MRSLFLASALLLGVATTALAQQVTVSGIVRERGDGSVIADATVRLPGVPTTLTNGEGRFALRGIEPGSYTLAIEALGYERRRIDIVVRNDTTLVIELTPDPVRLEGVTARGITVRGRLVDAESGARLWGGEVIVQPGSRRIGVRSGDFRVRGVPRGTVRFTARVLEYLPESIEFDAQRDTTLQFDMRIDSVGIRLIQRQVQRLADRAQEQPYSVRALGRDDIRQAGAPTVGELIFRNVSIQSLSRFSSPFSRSQRSQGREGSDLPAPCIKLDDVDADFDMLLSMPPDIVERIEIFDFDGGMIRVYTKRYVAGLMRRETLPKVMYMTSGLIRVCI